MGTAGDITTGSALAGALWQPLRTCGSDAPLTTSAGGTYCAQNTGLYGDVQPKRERVGVYGRFTIEAERQLPGLSVDQLHAVEDHDHPGTPNGISSSTPHNLSKTSSCRLPCCPTASSNPNNPFAAEGYDALIRYRFSDIPNHAQYTNRMARMVRRRGRPRRPTGTTKPTWSSPTAGWKAPTTATSATTTC
ncbi:hypothetical protein ACRAWD_05750 [Caulobacter segnis]